MITSLALKNFRAHRQLQLDFEPGLTTVVGANWTGKSSALAGIPFALFGSRAVPWPMSSLPTLGEDGMEVRLCFSHAGKSYQIVRSVKGATLTSGERTLATGHAAVTAEVEHILSTSLRDFLDFQVTAQGESDALLEANATKLSGFVSRVTGVDLVDAVQDRIKTETQICKGALLALPETAFDPDTVVQARSRYAEAALTAKAAEAAAEQAAEDYRVAAKLAAALQEAHLAATRARTEREVALRVLNNAEQRLSAAVLARQQRPVTDLDSSRKAVDALSAQAALAKSQREKLTGADRSLHQISVLLQDRSEIDLGPLIDQDSAAREAFRALDVEVVQALKALEDSACPYCHRAFDQSDPVALKQRLESVQEAKERAEIEKERAAGELAKARAQNHEVLELVKAMESWKMYRGQLEDGLVALVEPGRIEELTDACRRLEQAWNAYTAAEVEHTSALSGIERAHRDLELCEIVEGPTDAELTEGQLRSQTASETAWKAANAAKATLGTRDTLKAALERLEAEQAASLEVAARRQHFLTREAGLVELGKYLRGNRDRYTVAFWDQLLSYAGTLISSATSGSVTRLTRNAAGEFLYEEGGREMAVAGYASGMQRAIFSTAIKLSLAAAVGAPFRVMLFDEATAAAQDEVSLQFTSLLAASGRQVISVTHRAADAAAADHVIEL